MIAIADESEFVPFAATVGDPYDSVTRDCPAHRVVLVDVNVRPAFQSTSASRDVAAPSTSMATSRAPLLHGLRRRDPAATFCASRRRITSCAHAVRCRSRPGSVVASTSVAETSPTDLHVAVVPASFAAALQDGLEIFADARGPASSSVVSEDPEHARPPSHACVATIVDGMPVRTSEDSSSSRAAASSCRQLHRLLRSLAAEVIASRRSAANADTSRRTATTHFPCIRSAESSVGAKLLGRPVEKGTHDAVPLPREETARGVSLAGSWT